MISILLEVGLRKIVNSLLFFYKFKISELKQYDFTIVVSFISLRISITLAIKNKYFNSFHIIRLNFGYIKEKICKREAESYKLRFLNV